MKFATANAFRASLETRLAKVLAEGDQSRLTRLRKSIVFDRLLSRFAGAASSGWMVKGGVALDLRLGDRARSTQDLDLAIDGLRQEIEAMLAAAVELELEDFFRFHIMDEPDERPTAGGVTMSYQIRAELAGRRFEDFAIDVGGSPDHGKQIDRLNGHDFLAFAGIEPIEVPAISIEQHLAEKINAYTQLYGSGNRSTRVKDLVDIALIAIHCEPHADALRSAIRRTYLDRSREPIPTVLEEPPEEWAVPFSRLASHTGITKNFREAWSIASDFLNPVLKHSVVGHIWNPHLMRWDLSSPTQSDQIEPLG